jgi:hypothetical protein
MGYSGSQLVGISHNFSQMGMNALPVPAQNLYVETAKNQRMEAQASVTSAGASASNAQTSRMAVTGYDAKGPDGKPVHVPGELESTVLEREVQMKKVEAVMTTAEDKEFLAGFAQTMLSYRAGKPIPQSVMDAYNDELVKRSGGTVTKEEVSHWYKSNEVKSNYSWPTPQDTQSGSPSAGAPGAP